RGQIRGSYSMSCGLSWTGETPQERSDEEAQRQPRGKRSAWNENQQPCLTEPKAKEEQAICLFFFTSLF
ncbi:hypothetical protein V7654_14785, partial [Bacillus sp. JJ1609]|uniref:hypothetical protein n=1 Tax=Bacillus sp. JJ1609 TaxID=3122977 RepID=UPI002FFDC16D